MASEGTDSEDRAEATHEPRECMACRGGGKVISNLGGTTSTVTCPWCKGTGMRIPDVDAQARWSEQRTAGDDSGEQPGTGAGSKSDDGGDDGGASAA